MSDPNVMVSSYSDRQLKALIENHRRNNATDRRLYVAALEEYAARRGNGLSFAKSMQVIREAARSGCFLSYKELADQSGAIWNKVHYSVGAHPWDLVEFPHRRGWPMLSAIVVNKENTSTGAMKDASLAGFVAAAKDLGYAVDNADEFLREQQRLVFAWASINAADQHELTEEVAPLPFEFQLGNEPAKRFDLLMLNLQLALLKKSKGFERYRQQLQQIAGALEEQFAIPIVAAERELILEIQTEPWWIGVNVRLLELVRLRLRNLVQHVEKSKRPLVYSDFQDELGTGSEVTLPQVGAVDFKRFKRKARHFLLDHQNNLALQKLRRGKPLTPTDLRQLEALMISAGVGDRAQLDQAAELSKGLGRFIRSLVGLERGAVAEAFSAFLGTGSADQVEFVELVIEHLTHEGVMDPKLLYESPFTDIAPAGPEQVFPLHRTDELIDVIDSFNASAAVS